LRKQFVGFCVKNGTEKRQTEFFGFLTNLKKKCQ